MTYPEKERDRNRDRGGGQPIGIYVMELFLLIYYFMLI